MFRFCCVLVWTPLEKGFYYQLGFLGKVKVKLIRLKGPVMTYLANYLHQCDLDIESEII